MVNECGVGNECVCKERVLANVMLRLSDEDVGGIMVKICKGKGGSRDGWECLLRCRAELSPFILFYPRLLIRRAIQLPLAVSPVTSSDPLF